MQILSKPIVLIRICLFFGFSILMVGEKRDNVRQIDVVFDLFAARTLFSWWKIGRLGPSSLVLSSQHTILGPGRSKKGWIWPIGCDFMPFFAHTWSFFAYYRRHRQVARAKARRVMAKVFNLSPTTTINLFEDESYGGGTGSTAAFHRALAGGLGRYFTVWKVFVVWQT